MSEGTYKPQKRGGRGVSSGNMRDKDFVKELFVTSTHDMILFFTSLGNVFKLKAYEIPEDSRTSRGTAIINLLDLDEDERKCTFHVSHVHLQSDFPEKKCHL